MENLSVELAEFERTDREEAGSGGDHLADAFHEESDAMHDEENRGRETT